LDDCHQIFLQNGNTARLSLYTESGNISFKKGFLYEKNQIRFLMKGEKTFFKGNIPAFSVQRQSRSISVLQKNLVTIIQNISES
jgi:hypothetical protein